MRFIVTSAQLLQKVSDTIGDGSGTHDTRCKAIERSLLWFAPRKTGTGWSKPNKERIERMIVQGLVTPAGAARIEAAKTDGSWSALDAVEALELPPDLVEALQSKPLAANFWEAFPRSAKRGILEWIANAKTPQTRARRIDETAQLAAQNQRANHWRK